ncbi:hypothetical protein DUNSADRAFT_5084 [Dunaliella salina]|uniref:Uncharacterized protein n=1 Tax=Dunaliella salina TaxID=3046 RepID=A0ABQ7HAJ6_DUNSA|nr:hypothetical protein DUNSADRAFT_5084 [Dunaliella salina]|eukprot:KAF5843846.1 hypothetical protein DUNSADRAFT_5084 [Dunaliella salina]
MGCVTVGLVPGDERALAYTSRKQSRCLTLAFFNGLPPFSLSCRACQCDVSFQQIHQSNLVHESTHGCVSIQCMQPVLFLDSQMASRRLDKKPNFTDDELAALDAVGKVTYADLFGARKSRPLPMPPSREQIERELKAAMKSLEINEETLHSQRTLFKKGTRRSEAAEDTAEAMVDESLRRVKKLEGQLAALKAQEEAGGMGEKG